MSLTEDQFNQLLAALPGMLAGGGQGGGQQALGAASAVGPMGHCNLGIDKTGRLKRFNDWMKGAQAKIDFMGLTTAPQLGRARAAYILGEGSRDQVREHPPDRSDRRARRHSRSGGPHLPGHAKGHQTGDPEAREQGQISDRSTQHETDIRKLDGLHP